MARATIVGTRSVLTAGTSLLLAACIGGKAQRAAETKYVISPGIDVTRLLSPPPQDATGEARDLAVVRSAQESRTADQVSDAEASSVVDVFLFRSVLGPAFDPEHVPMTAAFFRRVLNATLPYLEETKDCWNRSRPFVVDPTLKPLEKSLASARLRRPPASSPSPPAKDSPCRRTPKDPAFSPSYPSGHATRGVVWATLLAEIYPDQKEKLLAKGKEIGTDRSLGGVHWPSDVVAGQKLGAAVAEQLLKDDDFKAELAKAKDECLAVHH